MQKKVTIIIPTRNAVQYLPTSLKSIGDFQDCEIIVINDGSTDGTDEFLKQYALEDNRVRVIDGLCKGASSARNLGIKEANGHYIAFLDADDQWNLNKLKIQISIMDRNPDIDMTFTDYDHIIAGNIHLGTCLQYWKYFKRKYLYLYGDDFFVLKNATADIYAENVIGTSSVVVKKTVLEAMGGFDESLSQSEDWDLWLRISLQHKIACIPKIMMNYLMHRQGNLSKSTLDRSNSLLLVSEKYHDIVLAQDYRALRIFKVRLYIAKSEACSKKQKISFVKYKMMAFIYEPNFINLKEFIKSIMKIFG